MKKIVILLISFLSVNNLVQSQSISKNVFFELGGPGIASFNYDTRFSKELTGWGGRVGIGGLGGDGINVFTFPIGINYLASGDNKHFFEVGINQTFLSANENIFDSKNTYTTTFTTLNFGYRSQPLKNGFVFRAAINPIIVNGVFMPFYVGFGFGYKF